jgi:hypothetical protein
LQFILDWIFISDFHAKRSGIDASGAIYHIIARGLERTKIFRDDSGQNNSLEQKWPCLLYNDPVTRDVNNKGNKD